MTTITTFRAGERSTTLDLASLRAGFAGELLAPAAGARYDDARAVFNAMFDRHPALIARPTSPVDVLAALRLARSSGVPIAVRGGGHSVAGYSTIDDGMVIDLSAMRRVTVDAKPDACACRQVPPGGRSTDRLRSSALLPPGVE